MTVCVHNTPLLLKAELQWACALDDRGRQSRDSCAGGALCIWIKRAEMAVSRLGGSLGEETLAAQSRALKYSGWERAGEFDRRVDPR